jgi:hypothetical protein
MVGGRESDILWVELGEHYLDTQFVLFVVVVIVVWL